MFVGVCVCVCLEVCIYCMFVRSNYTVALHLMLQGPHYLSTLYLAVVSTVWLLIDSPQNYLGRVLPPANLMPL